VAHPKLVPSPEDTVELAVELIPPSLLVLDPEEGDVETIVMVADMVEVIPMTLLVVGFWLSCIVWAAAPEDVETCFIVVDAWPP
jgi:hypothetical protein